MSDSSMSMRQRVEIVSPFLTVSDCGRLNELESVIGRGLKCFVDVGLALKEIHDKKLYRDQHATFEDYCRKRWAFSRIQGHRLIESASVATDLLPIGNNRLLTCESQARELVPLPPEMRRKVWARVTAPGSPPPTAKRIRKVVREISDGGGQREQPPDPPPDEAEGVECSLRATVIITPDTDLGELADLIRMGQVHWVLKNSRDKTLTILRVKTVESLEPLVSPALNGRN